jgi:hypothetical protein
LDNEGRERKGREGKGREGKEKEGKDALFKDKCIVLSKLLNEEKRSPGEE